MQCKSSRRYFWWCARKPRKILLDEKFNPVYREMRILLGYQPNTRTMKVELSPRRREKIIKYLEEEGWLASKTKATVRELAQVFGLLASICDIFLWGRAQLLILQQLLAEKVKAAYRLAQCDKRTGRLLMEAERELPKTMMYRLQHMKVRTEMQFLWKCKRKFVVTQVAKKRIRLIYNFLKDNRA